MKIEQVKHDSLTPTKTNSKKHSKEQIQQIADSIREFGFTNPILVSAEGEIIAGEGRWRAAKIAGLKTVPVIKLAHLSEAQRRAYLIVDNKLTETGGGWDEELLSVELATLRDDYGFELSITGFDETELLQLLGHGDDDEEDEPARVSGPIAVDGPQDDMSHQGHGKTPQESQEEYLASSIRQLVMAFDAETFEQVIGRLKTVRETHDIETNAQALLFLLERYEANQ